MNRSLLMQMILLRMGRYKMKTFLMSLGIIVSVLATVLVQTAGQSFRETFSAFIERAYPADSVLLVAGSGLMGGQSGSTSLRMRDVESVVNLIGDIKEWDPVVRGGARDVKNAGNNARVNVMGYSDKAESVRNRTVQEGEFFSAQDIASRAHVALIGSTTANRLFADESPIGAQLYIDNIPFKVKGVLESVGVDPHGGDQDDTIHVPYTTLMEQMLRVDFIAGATFRVEDRSRAEAVRQDVMRIMRERHQLMEGQPDDFSVITPVLMQDLVNKSMKTFNVFVPLIAGTAFLVSGLVILAIMLISIKERTPEIGLRKALGARPRDLEVQFVVEVLLVVAVASLIGLLFAQLASTALAPVLAARFGVKSLSPPVSALLWSVGAALVTGILGGVLPARSAAKLNPVQALR